jgi:hypothetical protein
VIDEDVDVGTDLAHRRLEDPTAAALTVRLDRLLVALRLVVSWFVVSWFTVSWFTVSWVRVSRFGFGFIETWRVNVRRIDR